MHVDPESGTTLRSSKRTCAETHQVKLELSGGGIAIHRSLQRGKGQTRTLNAEASAELESRLPILPHWTRRLFSSVLGGPLIQKVKLLHAFSSLARGPPGRLAQATSPTWPDDLAVLQRARREAVSVDHDRACHEMKVGNHQATCLSRHLLENFLTGSSHRFERALVANNLPN